MKMELLLQLDKTLFQVKKYLGKKIEKKELDTFSIADRLVKQPRIVCQINFCLFTKELDTFSISNRVAQRDDLLVLNFLRFKPPSSIFNNKGDTL